MHKSPCETEEVCNINNQLEILFMKYYLFQGILGVATKIKDLGQKVLKSSGNQGDNKKTDANGGAVRYSMFSFNLNKNFTILFLVSLNWPKN